MKRSNHFDAASVSWHDAWTADREADHPDRCVGNFTTGPRLPRILTGTEVR